LVSRVCDEFNIPPSEAVREIEEDTNENVITIMKLRAFARAKEQIDMAAKSKSKQMPMGYWIDRYFDIEFEDVRKKRDQKKRAQEKKEDDKS